MARQPRSRVRTRHRLQPFANFVQAPTYGLGQIDRLKFSFTGVGLSIPCGPGALGRTLASRRRNLELPFVVERPHDRRVELEFPQSRHLFRLTLSLRFVGDTWVGAGTVEANPTRLLSYLVAAHDRVDLTWIDLVRGARRSPSAAETLDGKENFVPFACLPNAASLDWCDYTHRYLDAVIETVNHALGQAVEHDLPFDRDAGTVRERPWVAGMPPPVHEPLVRLPPTHQWSFKEVEVYSECSDENAPARVGELGQIVRSLSGAFAQDERDSSPIHGESRQGNMPVIRVGLGAQDVHLTIYAKAQNRIRFEVCYRRYPMHACRLTAAAFATQDTGVRAALRAIRDNALRRTNQFLTEYQRHQQQSPPSIADLAEALSSTARVCGDAETLRQVLTLLIVNGGLSRTGDIALRPVLDRLVATGVLRSARMNLRPGADFVPAPAYEAAFRRLRSLPLA